MEFENESSETGVDLPGNKGKLRSEVVWQLEVAKKKISKNTYFREIAC